MLSQQTGSYKKNFGNLTKAIGGFGLPLSGALSGIKAVTKALWGMCATPVGAVIAAIALAFKAVHTWMTKSAEGQKVYTKLMAYFGSLAKSITDIVIIFGDTCTSASLSQTALFVTSVITS